MPNLKRKFKWAIDIIKSRYDKVIIRELDYGWGLAIAVENSDGDMRGITLQRPLFEGTGKNRKFINLYELRNTSEAKQNLTNWLRTCFDNPVKTKNFEDRVFDIRDC